MTFALGETIELQHDADGIRQHRDLDLAAQSAQAQRDHRCVEPWHTADVSAARVVGYGDVEPIGTHLM